MLVAIDRRTHDGPTPVEEAELFHEVERLTGTGTWDWDLVRDAMLWSRGLFRVYGYDADSPPPMNEVLQRIHPDDRDALSAAILKAGEPSGSEQYRAEFRLRRFDDDVERYFLAVGRVTHDDAGNAVRLIGTVRDVTTERRSLARRDQSSAMEGLTALGPGIAHDINNALTAVALCADELRDNEAVDPSTRSIGEEIGRAVESAALVVAHLLKLGESAHAKGPIDLASTVQLMVPVLRRIFRSADATLAASYAEAPLLIDAKPAEVHQVVMNLLLNAREAMASEGTVDMSVRRSGDDAVLTVSDSGVGIPPEHLERIFEPGFTTNQDKGGSGFGLTNVRATLLASGGSVSVASVSGQGTTVTVRWPLARKPRAAAVGSLVADGAPGHRILLVDDHRAIRRVMKRLIAREGHAVTTAGNGRVALELLEREPTPFDLVISDVSMPEMDGLALAETLSSARPNLPLVLNTGYAAELNDQQLPPNVRAVLLKPFHRRHLLETVEKAVALESDTASSEHR